MIDFNRMGDCPLCKGSGCDFCNHVGRVCEIVVDEATYDEIAMAVTDTQSIEDAQEALKKGPPVVHKPK